MWSYIKYNIAKYFSQVHDHRTTCTFEIFGKTDLINTYLHMPTQHFVFVFLSINLFMLLVVQQLNACFSPLSFFHHIKQLLSTGENVVSRRFRYLIHSNFVLVKNFFSSEWMHLSCFCPLLYKKLIEACRFIFCGSKLLN